MTRARELAKLGNENVISVNADNEVGIGSQTPDRRLDIGTGDLIVGHAITMGSLSGIISATAYHGDVSACTGAGGADAVPGISTTGFSTFKDISAQGITTISNLTQSTSTTTGALVISGGVGIAKNISVGGTITYDDVTNIDSVGLITARAGIIVNANGVQVTGIVTATSFTGSGANLTGLPAGFTELDAMLFN